MNRGTQMPAHLYKNKRKKIASQQVVADLLGVARETIARRETGAQRITKEAELALLKLESQHSICGFVND